MPDRTKPPGETPSPNIQPGFGPVPGRLITPASWAQIAMSEASEVLGTPEGAAKLCEARRYLACLQAISDLQQEVAVLREQLRACRGQDASGPAGAGQR